MIEKLIQLFNFRKQEEPQSSIEDEIETAFNSLNEYPIKLEFGDDIAVFADLMRERINVLRDDIKSETGFILPPVHMLQKEDLQENEVIIYIRGKETEHEFLIPNEKTIDSYIYDILLDLFENNIDEIFTMEYFEKYINIVQMKNSWLVWDISKQLGAYEIKTILVNIIKEKKSIADINFIFEKIDECLSENRDWLYTWKPETVSKRICKEI